MTDTPTPDLSPEALADRLEAVDHASVEDCFAQSPLYAHAAATLRALSAEVIRLRAECFMLAAGSCSGHYGDDHGHSRCSLVDAQRTRAEAAEARAEALAAEVIQLRTDNERLHQRVTILWEENNAARAALDTP